MRPQRLIDGFDLQGVRFDPDLPQTLRLEFAKSNTKVQKPKQNNQFNAALLPPAMLAAAATGAFPNRQQHSIASLTLFKLNPFSFAAMAAFLPAAAAAETWAAQQQALVAPTCLTDVTTCPVLNCIVL